jgi:hypothetical protein
MFARCEILVSQQACCSGGGDDASARWVHHSMRLRSSLLILLIVCVGCSRGASTYPVSGTARFDDGQPVRFGVVEIRSLETGAIARAKLDDTGAFTLGTFTEDDGAPAGEYQAIVVQFFSPPPTDHKHDQEHHHAHSSGDARVAAKFSDYATSPLRATVHAGTNNQLNFIVTHPDPRTPKRAR